MYMYFRNVNHIRMASFLLDIGKQNSPRCDVAKRGVKPGAILLMFLNQNVVSLKNE